MNAYVTVLVRTTGCRKRCRLALRHILVVASVAAATACVGASAARASSFYWYGENNSTCWQTGQPGAPSSACDDVGPGFLNSDGHTISESGGIKIIDLAAASGDYCATYNIGEGLTEPDENSEYNYTGLVVPKPYGKWQQADKHESVCQADETNWAQELRGNENAECTGAHSPCGMQHYVSFNSQGLNDRPWSSVFGEPSLLITTEAEPYTATTHGGGWAYICPLLRQGTTNHVLEYCIEEWRTGTGYNNFDVVGECTSTKNYAVDESITDFANTAKFATEMAGSTNTFTFSGSPTVGRFTAYITEADLVAAINADNGTCHTGLSTTPSEYELIGVEQGLEGRGLSELGARTANLQLRTEYTPRPPTATTGAPTNPAEVEAALNGSVNPDGVETSYHFEYGPTSAYGSSTSSGSAGAGSGSVPETAGVSELEPGTTYHYRLVATNIWGTSYGGDATFTTLPEFGTANWSVRTPSTEPNGWQWAFYRGEHGKLSVAYYTGGGWASRVIGETVASGTTPSVLRQPTANPNGDIWVYYQGAEGRLLETYYTETAGWKTNNLGMEMAPGTSPSALRTPTAEASAWRWVYYQDAAHDLHYVFNPGTGWANYNIGMPMAPGTSPSAIRLPTLNPSGFQWVYYQDSEHDLHYVYNPGSGWANYNIGMPMAPGTSPSATRVPTLNPSGFQWVYYQDSSHDLHEAYDPGPGWANENFGMSMAPETSPDALRLATAEPNNWKWVYYQDASHDLHEVYYTGSGWANRQLGGEMRASTSPSAVQLPVNEPNVWQWVFYDGSDGTLHETYYPSTSEWATMGLGVPLEWF